VASLNSAFKQTQAVNVRVMQGDGPLYDPEIRELNMNLEFMTDTDERRSAAVKDMDDA